MFKTSIREVAKKIALTPILAIEVGTTKGHSSLIAVLAMRYRVKATSLPSVKELHITETGVLMTTPLINAIDDRGGSTYRKETGGKCG